MSTPAPKKPTIAQVTKELDDLKDSSLAKQQQTRELLEQIQKARTILQRPAKMAFPTIEHEHHELVTVIKEALSALAGPLEKSL